MTTSHHPSHKNKTLFYTFHNTLSCYWIHIRPPTYGPPQLIMSRIWLPTRHQIYISCKTNTKTNNLNTEPPKIKIIPPKKKHYGGNTHLTQSHVRTNREKKKTVKKKGNTKQRRKNTYEIHTDQDELRQRKSLRQTLRLDEKG